MLTRLSVFRKQTFLGKNNNHTQSNVVSTIHITTIIRQKQLQPNNKGN